jgi:hypothetical protein
LRRQVGDQVGEVALVIGEFSVDPADGEGEAAGLGAPDGVFAGLVLTAAAARDGSEPVEVSAPRDSARSASLPVSSNARRRLIVRVLAVVSSRRAPSRMRSASRSPSARGVGSRSASRRSACNAARWASIGSDLPRRRSPRRGRSISTTVNPAACNTRASPIP